MRIVNYTGIFVSFSLLVITEVLCRIRLNLNEKFPFTDNIFSFNIDYFILFGGFGFSSILLTFFSSDLGSSFWDKGNYIWKRVLYLIQFLFFGLVVPFIAFTRIIHYVFGGHEFIIAIVFFILAIVSLVALVRRS